MVSEPESESSPRLGQSQNRNRNRAQGIDSLRTEIGIEKIGTGNLCPEPRASEEDTLSSTTPNLALTIALKHQSSYCPAVEHVKRTVLRYI